MAGWQAFSGFLEFFELAFITLIIGFLAAKLVHKIVRWIVVEFKLGFKLLPTFVEQVLYLVTLVVVLVELGLGRFLLGLLLFIIAGILFWFLLGIKDVVSNLLALRFVSLNLTPGRNVQIGSVSGSVKRIGWCSTIITNGEEHSIPHIYTKKIMLSQAK